MFSSVRLKRRSKGKKKKKKIAGLDRVSHAMHALPFLECGYLYVYVRFIDTPGGSKKKIRVGKNWPMSKKKKALVDSLL